MIKNRSIVMNIVLSLVTCGIYGIYWFITLTDESNTAAGQADGTSGGMAFLLTLVTCGIYGIYWAYKLGEKISAAKKMRNMGDDGNTAILYLILNVVGLGIVTYCLAQNELNKMANA